jgi:hypothetical protein
VNLSTVSASVSNSAVTQIAFRVVELLGAHRPDLERIIWASVSAHSAEEQERLAALITPRDAELLERVIKAVAWSFGVHVCDWGGLA